MKQGFGFQFLFSSHNMAQFNIERIELNQPNIERVII